MAKYTGNAGHIFLPHDAGAPISNQAQTIVDGYTYIDIPIGHNTDEYVVRVTKITSDAGGSNELSEYYTYTCDGSIHFSEKTSGTVYVTYSIWSVEQGNLIDMGCFFNWSLNVESNVIDSTCFEDANSGYRSFIPSLISWNLSASKYYKATTDIAFTAATDEGGGRIKLTLASAYSGVDGQLVRVTDSTNYNGLYHMDYVDTTHVRITDTYAGTDTGTVKFLDVSHEIAEDVFGDGFICVKLVESDDVYWKGFAILTEKPENIAIDTLVDGTWSFQGSSDNGTARNVLVRIEPGSDKVTDGGFPNGDAWTYAADPSVDGWVLNGDADCDGQQSVATTLSQDVSAINGEIYLLEIDFDTRSAGNVSVECGGTEFIASTSTTGHYRRIRQAGSSGDLEIIGDSDFVGVLDDVSVKLYTEKRFE